MLTVCVLASRQICSQLTYQQFESLLVAVPECVDDVRCFLPNPVYPYALEVRRRFCSEFAGANNFDVVEQRLEELPIEVRWVEGRTGRRVGRILPNTRAAL